MMLVLLLFVYCFGYVVDPNEISLTGFSSGAFFGVQVQVAFSSIIKGAGISAGGPYYCAEDTESKALSRCMYMCQKIDVDSLEKDTQKFASEGKIDDLSNLVNQQVYLYSGTMDMTVHQNCVKQLQQMYEDFGVKNVTTEFTIASNHAFITDYYGSKCMMSVSPYIDNCNYDEAYNILDQMYNLQNDKVDPIDDNILSFDQSKYNAESWDTKGYAYVPTNCQNNATCKLHLVFHGCEQYYAKIGDVFIKNSGHNRWAESNDIIVVYTQTVSEKVKNPNGCYDWWGYTNKDYAFKTGSQMAAVKSIIDDFSDPNFVLN